MSLDQSLSVASARMWLQEKPDLTGRIRATSPIVSLFLPNSRCWASPHDNAAQSGGISQSIMPPCRMATFYWKRTTAVKTAGLGHPTRSTMPAYQRLYPQQAWNSRSIGADLHPTLLWAGSAAAVVGRVYATRQPMVSHHTQRVLGCSIRLLTCLLISLEVAQTGRSSSVLQIKSDSLARRLEYINKYICDSHTKDPTRPTHVLHTTSNVWSDGTRAPCYTGGVEEPIAVQSVKSCSRCITTLPPRPLAACL